MAVTRLTTAGNYAFDLILIVAGALPIFFPTFFFFFFLLFPPNFHLYYVVGYPIFSPFGS